MFRNVIQRMREWRLPFTVTGRLLAVAMFFSFLALLDDSLAGLLSYLLWLLTLAFAFGLYYRPTLEVRVLPPELLTCGQKFMATIEVRNVGRRPAYDLLCNLVADASFDQFAKEQTIPLIDVGDRVRVDFPLQANRRGVFELHALRCESLFPLAVFRFLALYRLAQRVHVAPAFDDVTLTVDQNEHGQTRTAELVGHKHQSGVLEYVGSREYRPGMSVRRWDFASWARLGNPAVREFSEGNDSLNVLLIDTRLATSDTVDGELESVLSTTAALIDQHASDPRQQTLLILVGESISCLDGRDLSDPTTELMMALAEVQGTRKPIDWANAVDEILGLIPADSKIIAVIGASNEVARTTLESVRHRQEAEFLVLTGVREP